LKVQNDCLKILDKKINHSGELIVGLGMAYWND